MNRDKSVVSRVVAGPGILTLRPPRGDCVRVHAHTQKHSAPSRVPHAEPVAQGDYLLHWQMGAPLSNETFASRRCRLRISTKEDPYERRSRAEDGWKCQAPFGVPCFYPWISHTGRLPAYFPCPVTSCRRHPRTMLLPPLLYDPTHTLLPPRRHTQQTVADRK